MKSNLTPALMASLIFLSSCQELSSLLFDQPSPSPSAGSSSVPISGASPVASSLPVSGSSVSTLTVSQTSSQAGQMDETQDRRVVSANYRVKIPAPGAQMPVIEIPVQKDYLPDQLTGASFQPEYQDAAGAWQADGKLIQYDSAAQLVRFVPGQPAPSPQNTLAIQQDTQIERVYRIRVYYFSNQLTASRDDSMFRIHYYPSRLANTSHVRADADWNSKTGFAVDPMVPDFVEDLDHALNELYQRLIQVQSSQGNLFTPFRSPLDVYVEDVGGDAGDSPLGGPMRISNHKISDYQDLKLTAGHELVHVLQGQYYSLKGLFTGRQNRWFIEAVANYLSARAAGLDDAGKKKYYGEFYNDYLSVGLTDPNDSSMYAAGHFLDWLSQKYGATVVPDALQASSGNDLIGLSTALKAQGVEGGISTAFETYLKDILTHPEGTAGFHKDIRLAMYNHAIGNQHLSSAILNDKRTYNTLIKTLPPMSAVYVQQNMANSSDALLVADSQFSKGALIGSLSYSGTGNVQSYTKPLDTYSQVPSKVPLSVKNVRRGQNDSFEQLIYNDSPASKATIEVHYLLLQKPEIGSWDNEGVNWATVGLGNIPLGQVEYQLLDGRTRVLKVQPRANESLIKTWHYFPDRDYSAVPSSDTYRFYEAVFTQKPNLTINYGDLFWPEIQSQVNVKLEAVGGDSTNLGGQIHLKATVTGDPNVKVIWKMELADYYKDFVPPPSPGSLSSTDTEATWNAPAQVYTDRTSVVVTATSVADPTRSATISLSAEDPDYVCVPAGTQVSLANGGHQAIETMQAGQEIVAIDPQSKSEVKATVEKVVVHDNKTYTLNEYKTDSGDDLRLTPNHPVLMADGTWHPAQSLQVGDQIYQYQVATHSFVLTRIVVIIREESRSGKVYNLKTSRGNYVANELVIHNKCLAKGSLIQTPDGPVPVDKLQIGQLVWGDLGGQRMPVLVTQLYAKQTILKSLPGKRLNPAVAVTINHLVQTPAGFVRADQTNWPDQEIAGEVYDLNTSSGTYYAEGSVLMKTGS